MLRSEVSACQEKTGSMSEESDQYRDLVRRRQEHIGRYFWRAHRAFVAIAVRKLAARGHTGLGMAHTTLIANHHSNTYISRLVPHRMPC